MYKSVLSDADITIQPWTAAPLLAPAVTVGETEGAMDSTSRFFLASSFAYNFVRK